MGRPSPLAGTPIGAPVVNVYAGGTHDRAGQSRLDEAAVAALLAHITTRFLPVWRGRHLISALGLVRIESARLGPDVLATHPHVFLGIEAGIALFAIDYSDRDAPPDFGAPDAAFAEIRPVAASLVSTDAALLAQARGLLHWRRMHRFCGQCGAPMRVAEGGHKLVCTAHPEHLNFPRTDPVVIMLVRRGDQALLARGTRFPPDSRTLSALAGFIEPGESAEEAVAREVFEEVGLRLSGVRYHSSQPWPFPGSLMLGFDALAEDGALAIDPTEIAEARWLTRAQVRAHAALGFDVPGPAAIARRLISDWLAEDGGPGLGDLS